MWHYLKGAQDWEAYCRQCEDRWGLAPGTVDFGFRPEGYPVAVTAVRVGPAQALTAFFTPENARALLGMGGTGAAIVEACKQLKDPGVAEKPAPVAEKPPAGPTVREHAVSVAAHLMTVQSLLFGVGVCKPEIYATLYQANLARVDQWTAEDWERLQSGAAAAAVNPRKAAEPASEEN